ncbi:glycosyltransferase family 2 protein [Eupransor demetentiae]|uniref:Catalytic subunit of cellulose synthase and poly-beta-1 n=1 Tax=Eupransor demetentiae TaxID=3109584 RepID=A0ABM9N4N6_9LACO|nr:6-N-acetylglucosamine synthase (BcsA) [Lactobacillaceae bacterium LMG 33000]
MTKELVSVITPVYNAAKYLKDFLRDIDSQTACNFEWLLIDDGSSDESWAILTQWEAQRKGKPGRVHLIQQSNQGVSAARNAGLKEAQGDFLIFGDSDDRLSPDFVAAYHHAIVANKTDLAFFNLRLVNPVGEVLGFKQNLPGKFNVKEAMGNILRQESGAFVVSYISRRSLWRDLEFNPNLSFLEDEELMLRLLTRAKETIFLPECHYDYVQHPTSRVNAAALADYQNGLAAVQAMAQTVAGMEDKHLDGWAQLRQLDLLLPLIVLTWRHKEDRQLNRAYRQDFLKAYREAIIPAAARRRWQILAFIIVWRLKPVLLAWYRQV